MKKKAVTRVGAIVLFLGCILSGFDLCAGLELSRLFTDHMVMQRNMQVPVWGWAEPGEEIKVTIDKQEKKSTADKDGKWMVRLDPMDTGTPRKMTVKGKTETLEFNDILLGEVWICGGQSNMEWKLIVAKNGKEETAAADYPEVRFFSVGNGTTPEGPVERLKDHYNPGEYKSFWQACSPKSIGSFSAVGYFFGRDLQRSLKVPVGLIWNAWGATPAESWISREAMIADPDIKPLVERWDNTVKFAQTPEGKKELEEVFAEYEAKQKEARAKGEWFWRSDAYQEPLKKLSCPGTFFNGRVNPLIPFAIRGVIWYQGEGNTGMGYAYRKLFPLVIKDWRNRWGQGDFPFIFVQLANWSGNFPKEPQQSEWAELRESQLRTLSLPNTAMAVAIDIGEAGNIHPANKQDVGKRLALAARGTVYGEKIEYSGPIYRDMKVDGDSIRLSFDHVGGGLVAKDGELKQFAIAGEDQKFVWASARIDGNSVVVHSDAVAKPVAVRYAWATNPAGCNLYNKEDLPASPFRTDDWRGVTTEKDYKSQMNKPISFKIKK